MRSTTATTATTAGRFGSVRRAALALAVGVALAGASAAPAAAAERDPHPAIERAERVLPRTTPAHKGALKPVSATKQRQLERRAQKLITRAQITADKRSPAKTRAGTEGCVVFSDGALCAVFAGYHDGYDHIMYLWAMDASGRFLGDALIYHSSWYTFLYSMGF